MSTGEHAAERSQTVAGVQWDRATPFVPWPRGLTLLLGSGSPRRAELLRLAGVPFTVAVAPHAVEEEAAATARRERAAPGRYAELAAEAKASAVATAHPGSLVLGADTIVVLDGEILGKPNDAEDAVRMLTRLAGRTHSVITAMAFMGGVARARWLGREETRVEFLPLNESALRRYVATGEPLDKAGAYGIQGYGAMMVRRVDGCYFNVMGLPLARLGQALREVLGDGDGGVWPGTEGSPP